MKLFYIPDTRKFMEKIAGTTGNVFMIGSNGATVNLKETAQYLIRSGMADTIEGMRDIDLVFEKQSDMISILNYVVGMNCNRSVA